MEEYFSMRLPSSIDLIVRIWMILRLSESFKYDFFLSSLTYSVSYLYIAFMAMYLSLHFANDKRTNVILKMRYVHKELCLVNHAESRR